MMKNSWLSFGVLSCAVLAAALPAQQIYSRSPKPTPHNGYKKDNYSSGQDKTLMENVFAAAAWSWGGEHGWSSLHNNGQCDLSKASMPSDSSSPSAYPSPSGTLKHVLIGRGTQNYSCEAESSAEPTPVGAVASLYDASCIASAFPAFLSYLPNLALRMPNPDTNSQINKMMRMDLIGHHYFTDPKSPVFNLDTSTNGDKGYVEVKKKGTAMAPTGSPAGDNGKGSCAWLYLTKNPEMTPKSGQETYKEVYRVNTAGGSAPDKCEGMPKTFEVQYAAEYWFYS